MSGVVIDGVPVVPPLDAGHRLLVHVRLCRVKGGELLHLEDGPVPPQGNLRGLCLVLDLAPRRSEAVIPLDPLLTAAGVGGRR